jgi:hypothetical protein
MTDGRGYARLRRRFFLAGIASLLLGCHLKNEKPITIYNKTPVTMVDIQVIHRGERTPPFSLAPGKWKAMTMTFDDQDPYVLESEVGEVRVILGACRVQHKWVDGHGIAAMSIDPPAVTCFEDG